MVTENNDLIKGVIFDLDGTLADTLCDLRKAMNEMLVHFNYPERDISQIKSAICYGQREFVKRSLPKEALCSEEIIDRCQKYYSQCYSKCYNDNTSPYPMIEETLMKLQSLKIKLSVVTNKSQLHADEVIKKCLPDARFETVIGGQGAFAAKPDPAGALEAARLMGAKPGECLFVGDSDVDIMTGKNAGMIAVGVGWGYRSKESLADAGADFIIERADELISIING